jgi:hypothetical protein
MLGHHLNFKLKLLAFAQAEALAENLVKQLIDAHAVFY